MNRPVAGEASPALAFATAAREAAPVRWLRAAAILARSPREAVAILRARLAGKRVRAQQARAALFGLDHGSLQASPAVQARLLAGTATEFARTDVEDVAILLPGDLASSGLAAASSGRAAACLGRAAASAPILVLTAPGHALVPGATDRLTELFAQAPTIQLVYGDALLGPVTGAATPLLRPAFDPEYLMAVDYIGPVLAIRRSALAAIVGPDDAASGAFELVLRTARHFGRQAIAHLPGILSRSDPAESPPAGDLDQAAILRRSLDRSGGHAIAITIEPDGIRRLSHPLPEPHPLVSLIVPTRDRVDLLRTCLTSLIDRTDWPRLEILICDNDSREPETLGYFRDLTARGVARIIPCPGPFDFAGMNNAAACAARGRVLAFINNDVEALHPDWLERLVREALRPDVGAVGAKLLDGQGRIQHGGVLLGPGGLVTHAHRFFAGNAPGYLAGLRATREVSAVTAACLVVEAAKFSTVGGFDSAAFAVDFNDVDLCLRLNEAGYRTLFVPGAVLRHDEAASRRWTLAARASHGREVVAFQKRWGPLLAQDPHYHPGFDPDLGTYARLRPDCPGAGPIRAR